MENIRLAFQGIWGHKMRSFLTMLGIIIGIASIITIVSTIKGTNEQIKQNLIGSGGNVVTIQLYQGDMPLEFSYSQVPSNIKMIDEGARKMLESIDNVDSVSFYTKRDWAESISAGKNNFDGKVYGIDKEYFKVNDYGTEYGRTFTSQDIKNFNKVVIIDHKAASSLFPGEYPIGKVIEIKSEAYTVVGVVEKNSTFTPQIETLEDYYMYSDTSGGAIFIPSSAWAISYRFDEPLSVAVKADSTDNMTRVGKAVADYLTANYVINNDNGMMQVEGGQNAEAEGQEVNDKLSYRSQDLLQQAQQLQEMSNATNQQLIWIASISLLVGGIGVMNIMLVSVTERTSEIGLKKALGAKKRRILSQFLTEASMLTSLGGIIGVVIGIALAQLISTTNGIPVAISVPAIAVSVIFSMVIGVVFGLLPAVKAANLSPIEALRRD